MKTPMMMKANSSEHARQEREPGLEGDHQDDPEREEAERHQRALARRAVGAAPARRALPRPATGRAGAAARPRAGAGRLVAAQEAAQHDGGEELQHTPHRRPSGGSPARTGSKRWSSGS